MDDLRGDSHDVVASAVATIGTTLLELPADARQTTSGEEDAYWELLPPRRVLSFEVKLAPKVQRVVNHDVEQAEGATHALRVERKVPACGLLITPHDEIDETAEARLDQVRVLNREVFGRQIDLLLDLLDDYRHGRSDDAGARAARRKAVEPSLPPLDWLWKATKRSSVWVEPAALRNVWRAGVPAWPHATWVPDGCRRRNPVVEPQRGEVGGVGQSRTRIKKQRLTALTRRSTGRLR